MLCNGIHMEYLMAYESLEAGNPSPARRGHDQHQQPQKQVSRLVSRLLDQESMCILQQTLALLTYSSFEREHANTL